VFITAAKAAMRGEEIEDLTPQRVVSEAIDRSGLLAYLGPYVDSAIKIGGNSVNEALGAEIFETSSRYRQNNWWQSLLGPSFSAVAQSGELVAALGDGDMEKVKSKALNLAPYATFWRLAAIIGDGK
jgi:hypothetical protein